MRTSENYMLHNQTQMAEAEYAFLTGLTGFEKFKHKVLFFQEKEFSGTT
jgi:flagellar assembly factor FliW